MTEKMSRLGIFVFYDPQGVVDDYVLRLMEAFRPHFTRLITISNTKLDHVAKERLEQYSDDLFVRENRGLDAAAFKEGLISFCGWEEVERYDEVVLMNDTFFGPVHSFDDMFEEMSGRDLDFWGMTAAYQSVDGWKRVKYGYVPSHIPTFFVAFRRNMVCTDEFRSYWYGYNESMNDFISVVTQHEMVMTKHFQDLGFRWDAYANTQSYCSANRSENFNLYHFHAHTMMRDMNFPVLKKKVLNINLQDQLFMQDLESASDALAYIQNETDYDTKLIWDNVLRLYNVTDLYQSLHLNYVLPSVQVSMPEGKRIALVYHVANPFFAEQICIHAAQHQETVDVYVLPGDKKVEAGLREILTEENGIRILAPTHQKTEMGNFVLRCKELAEQYDYLGFAHDVDNPEHYPTTVPESTVYGYLQNIANDPAYLSQVINCFEQNPRLGILGTPFPIHHHGFGAYGNEWGGYFATVKTLADKMKLKCNLKEEKLPFMITGAFWCRTEAICDLWKKDWSEDQFYSDPVKKNSKMNEALKRILPFAAQSQRYYSGIVMHTNYAAMRITGQQAMLDQIVGATRQNLGCFADFYAGYMQQLQSAARTPAMTPVAMDISNLRIRNIVRMYLERHTPRWFSDAAYRTYMFLKNRLHFK